MADATSNISRDFKDLTAGSLAFKVKNAEVVPVGVAAAVDYSTGLLENMDDTAGLIPCGVVVSEENGGTTPITGTNLATEADPGATVRGGIVVKDVTVTGVTAYSDIGAFVYATDNQTFTLTRPADDAIAVGVIVDKGRATTNTTCDVYFFNFVEAVLMSGSAAGGGKSVKALGFVFGNDLRDATDNAVLLDIQMFGHGNITKLYAVSAGYDTNWAAGSVITDFSIGGTTIKTAAAATVTLTLTEASIDAAADRGTTIDTSADIGSANEFHDGDNLTMNIVNSGSTVFSDGGTLPGSGGWNIYAEIEWLPGT